MVYFHTENLGIKLFQNMVSQGNIFIAHLVMVGMFSVICTKNGKVQDITTGFNRKD